GIGYQTAILAAMGADVHAIERHQRLVGMAAERLDALGYRVQLICGDGARGWPEPMMFDRILSAAAAAREPTELFMRQLADGGRAVLPVESDDGQNLLMVDREGDKLHRQLLDAVRFVPLVTDSL